MYEDPERHSLTFQSYVQLTMTELHLKKPSTPVVDLKVDDLQLCCQSNLLIDGPPIVASFLSKLLFELLH